MECPKCGSKEVHQTQEVYAPVGQAAMKCGKCYHTWLIDVDFMKIDEQAVDFHIGIDYVKVRLIVREEIDLAIKNLFQATQAVANKPKE